MDNTKVNSSIKCTVDECEYHCDGENYCSLPGITVGSSESNPTRCENTDCESFRVK